MAIQALRSSGGIGPGAQAAPSQAPDARAVPVRNLTIGSQGRDVAQLKDALRGMRYAVDRGSTFTEQTHHAVMAFQKVNGLARDGVAGPQTQGALADPVRPRIGGGADHRIVVDLSDQVLYVVDDDRLKKVVNASTGNPDLADGLGEATPAGKYRVYRKVPGVDPGPSGPLYDPSYFLRGIAVHGSPSIPAYPASHGCVRIPMHLSKAIYDQMPLGTQVKVRP